MFRILRPGRIPSFRSQGEAPTPTGRSLASESMSVSWFGAADVSAILDRHPHLTVRKRGFFRVTFTITGRVDVVAAALVELEAWAQDELTI